MSDDFFEEIATEILGRMRSQPNGDLCRTDHPDWKILLKTCSDCNQSLAAVREDGNTYCLVCASILEKSKGVTT